MDTSFQPRLPPTSCPLLPSSLSQSALGGERCRALHSPRRGRVGVAMEFSRRWRFGRLGQFGEVAGLSTEQAKLRSALLTTVTLTSQTSAPPLASVSLGAPNLFFHPPATLVFREGRASCFLPFPSSSFSPSPSFHKTRSPYVAQAVLKLDIIRLQLLECSN